MKKFRKSVSTKLVARIFGGLGNQLFCYAAARRLALVNNVDLVIDDFSGFIYDTAYKRHYQLDHFSIPCRKATRIERLEPFSKIRRAVKRLINKFLSYRRRKYITQDGSGFDSQLLDLKPQGTVYLEGYWQSEEYFKDIESVIRRELKISSPLDELNLRLGRRIRNCNAIAIHIRFFDITSADLANKNQITYYRNAMGVIESRVSKPHYFIFSDRPDLALTCLPLLKGTYTLVEHNKGDEAAYADLWLMSQCQHHIIADSTFSWWGAWLSENINKIVICPKFSLSPLSDWGFSGLLPDKWIKI